MRIQGGRKMIENGMLVNQTAYDTQCREPKTVCCACCGENVPEYDAVEILGQSLLPHIVRPTGGYITKSLGRESIDEVQSLPGL